MERRRGGFTDDLLELAETLAHTVKVKANSTCFQQAQSRPCQAKPMQSLLTSGPRDVVLRTFDKQFELELDVTGQETGWTSLTSWSSGALTPSSL